MNARQRRVETAKVRDLKPGSAPTPPLLRKEADTWQTEGVHGGGKPLRIEACPSHPLELVILNNSGTFTQTG